MAVTTGSASYVRTQVTVGTTSGAAGLTGPAGSFSQRDKGALIVHANLPAGTTILSVTSATVATASANATATGSATATIGPRVASAAGFTGWKPEVDSREADYTVASNNSGTAPLDRLSDAVTRTPQYVEH